jgi:hypothetical protein
MEIFIVLGALFIVVISAILGGIYWDTRCFHDWKVVDRGTIMCGSKSTGVYLVKECTVCHKLKREEI